MKNKLNRSKVFLESAAIRLALFVLFIAGSSLVGQEFQVGLTMNPNPSPYLSDWEERTETVLVTITNLTNNARDVKVKARILDGSQLRAETNSSKMPSVNVGPLASQVLSAEHVVPLQAIDLYGASEETIVRSGKIPAGTYQICVTILDANTEELLSQEVCQFFGITAYQAPFLQIPPNNQSINVNEVPTILFGWSPVVPNYPAPFRYVLQVFEVLSGQDPIQAFRSNRPILERDVAGATQYLWPPDISFLNDGNYIWSVRVLDDQDNPVTEPDGYAEPFEFEITGAESEDYSCSFAGISVTTEEGLVLAQDDLNVSSGSNLYFTPSFEFDCAPGCSPIVNGNWEFTFTGSDGTNVTQSTGDQAFYIASADGDLVVAFSGSADCVEGDCSCEGAGAVNVGIGSKGGSRADYDTTKKDTIRNREEVKYDIRNPSLDSIPYSILCNPLPPQSDGGAPVALSVTLDQPDRFPYPRAVPIRAHATDMDYAIFRCVDCEGIIAKKYIPVPDSISVYKWELEGLGSLNEPINADSVKSIDDSIASITEKLSAVDDSISQTKSDTARLKKLLESEQKKAAKDLPELKKRLNSIDSSLKVKRDTLRQNKDSIRAFEKKRLEFKDTIDAHGDSLKIVNERIDSTQKKLRGDPSDSEKSALEDVVEARTRLADADSAVSRKTRGIQTEAERLDAGIVTKGGELTDATELLASKQKSAAAKTKEIASLRSRVYAPPGAWDYYRSQRGFQLAVMALSSSSLVSIAEPIATSQTTIDDLAISALTAPAAAVRRSEQVLFRTEMAGLLAMMSSGCETLSTESEKTTCRDAMTSVLDASVMYDDALDRAVAAGWVLDPSLLHRISALQTELRALETGIKSEAASVKLLSVEYNDLLKARNDKLKALDDDRTRLAVSAEDERVSLVESEQAYYAIVKEREEDLELNRDVYLTNLATDERERDSLRSQVEFLRDSIAVVDRDTASLNQRNDDLDREIASLEEEKEEVQRGVDELERIIALTPAEYLKPLLEQLTRLEKRKKELEEELARLKKKREKAVEGNKEALGPIVYYIPPPLEEIVKDKEMFEKLKDTVSQREIELDQALTFKAGVQGPFSYRYGADSSPTLHLQRV